MKRRSVWVVEYRCYLEEYSKWSDWDCTFDDDSGPYDVASLARDRAHSLSVAAKVANNRFEYRAVRYDASK